MEVKKLQFSTIPAKEYSHNDILFRGNILRKTGLHQDNHFKRPSLTIHVYHNIPGKTLYCTHRSGLRSVIEYNTNLITDKRGVFIIHREDMGKDPRLFTDNLMHYITEMDDGYVKDRMVNNVLHKNDHVTYDSILRDVTYIPIDDIDHFEYMVDYRSKLMISMDDEPIQYPSDVKSDTTLTQNKFNVTIYRAIPEVHKYYINVLNVVIPVRVLESQGKESAILSFFENGVSKNRTIDIEDFELHGIYKSPEEAKHSGDLQSGMMLEKYRHEHNMATINQQTTFEELKARIELSNLSISDKELALELARLKLTTEGVKARAIDAKASYENTGNRVKEVGIFSDILTTGSKLLRSIL